jgi:NADPH2:quinone reductase
MKRILVNTITNMRAVEITQPGPPDVLKICERPTPIPRAGEVLIEVRAAGINRADAAQRAGLYPPPPGASELPGLEIAGTVIALGEDVTSWKVGDAVCALTNGGGYAEYCAVPAGQCLPIPGTLSLTEAGALPETLFTVWSNIWDRAAIQPGESLLIQGGASGIGTIAIQLARALRHPVFATAGSPEKCAVCERLGAQRAVNYKTEDFVEVIKAATGGRGVDIILDMVGGSYMPRELRTLANDGRLVLISFLGGAKAELDFTELLRRRLSITGSTLRPRPAAFKAAIAARLYRRVWPLIEAGTVKPLIHATFPLEEAARAHHLMESDAHIGKIVLTV